MNCVEYAETNILSDEISAATIEFLPDLDQFLVIEEGTGDNLLPEDLKEGYVDYINYSLIRRKDMCEADGGMILLKKLYRDIYPPERTEALIQDVLEEHFGNRDLVYIDAFIEKDEELEL